MTRVLIADDDYLMRAGLVELLSADPAIKIVGQAASGREALERTRRLDPDVVLMDVRMPDFDGIAATRELTRAGVRARVLIREQPDTLMVPQVAVGSSQLGKYLYVIGDGSKVEMRQVTLGPINGEKVAVLDGIQAHDKVITGNLQKIGPGMPVQPLPSREKQADAGH